MKLNIDKLSLEYYDLIKNNRVFFDGSINDELTYFQHQIARYGRLLEELENIFCSSVKNVKLNLLEVGYSPFVFVLKKYFGDRCDITLLDHNRKLGNQIKKIIGINFLYQDLKKPEIKRKKQYDIINFSEVLEHIPIDENILIKNLTNQLLPGGTIIITTPNFNSLKNLVSFLCGKNLSPLFSEIKKTNGVLHVREYTKNEIVKLISGTKTLSLIKISYENFFDNIKTLMVYRKNKYLSFIPVMLYVAITKTIPCLKTGMLAVAHKKRNQ